MFNMKRIMIILFIGLILFLGYKSEPKLLLFIKYPQQYKEYVFKYSDLYQIEDEIRIPKERRKMIKYIIKRFNL